MKANDNDDAVNDESPYLPIPPTGPLTPQHISDFDHQRQILRENISIVTQPIKTLRLLFEAASALLKYGAVVALTHPVVVYLIIPTLVVWLLFDRIDPNGEYGPYRKALDTIIFFIEFSTWWIGLGILSSIGLGFGLQSGVLFLFPHIFRVCVTAQTCKSINFDSDSNMWFRESRQLFKCLDTPTASQQSTGTAIGEIPPYWMTRAARLASLEAGDDESSVPDELKQSDANSLTERFKVWMMEFLKKHGFYGVLLMASFPNIAFDLCGIFCGHYLMPFWTFFWATFVGKAIIRNLYQSVIYVALCHESYLELLIHWLQRLTPDSLDLDHSIRLALEQGREKFHNFSTGKSSSPPQTEWTWDPSHLRNASTLDIFVFVWQYIVMRLIIVLFLVSCINQFSQYYQLTIDREESKKLRKRLPINIVKSLTSPESGRLRLPPPSVEKKKRPSSSSPQKHSQYFNHRKNGVHKHRSYNSPLFDLKPTPILRSVSHEPGVVQSRSNDRFLRSINSKPVLSSCSEKLPVQENNGFHHRKRSNSGSFVSFVDGGAMINHHGTVTPPR